MTKRKENPFTAAIPESMFPRTEHATPEEIVKRKWPDALVRQCSVCVASRQFHAWSDHARYADFHLLGNGDTEAEAWADAAQCIEAQKEQE